MKYLLWGIFHLWAVVTAQAQYFNTGTEPAAVPWRQIHTEKFTVIYPHEIDSIAQRYAWLLDRSYRAVQRPLRADLQRVPVVLHPYNVYSNGVVVWAPRRMELFTTPPAQGYAQMWDKQLALHETRHVAQMSKLHEGFFKYLHYFIGEQSESIAAGVYLSKWFLEGDATAAETAFSNSGRGRQAEFLMPVKALTLSGYRFSWDTWINGSYRYNIPNEYVFGYALAAQAYRQAGNYIFGDMLGYTARHPLHIPPPARALKKFGGFRDSELFAQSFARLEEQWRHEDTVKADNAQPVQELAHPAGTTYLAYRSITAIDTATLLAIRSGLKYPQQLVTIDRHGREQLVGYTGAVNSTLRKAGGKVYWSAPVPHIRWEQLSYSVVKCYDTAAKKIKTLTRRTRYFSPAPSPDGRRLAVVENTPKGENFLALLDTERYAPVQRIALPAGQVPREITWDSRSEKLYCTVLSDEGLALRQYDLLQQQWSELIPPGVANLRGLKTCRNYVLFESGYNGTNNIYALQVPHRKVYRLTDARFGAFDPALSADSTQLLFANYTATGYTIAARPLDESCREEIDFTAPRQFEAATALSAAAGFNIDTLQVPASPYRSRRYSGLAHLFRIHSWAPFYFRPDALLSASLDTDIMEQVGWGATVLSQNILGTLTSQAAYRYRNGFHSGHFSLAWRGFYPVIDASLDLNDRHREKNFYLFTLETPQPYLDAYVRMYAPLNRTSGAWQTGLTPQLAYHFTNDEYFSLKNSTWQYLQYLTAGATFYRQLPPAVRDIFPRWGYSLRALYSFPVFNNNIYPTASIQGSCYLPGLFANHGLSLTAGYAWLTHTGEGGRYRAFTPISFPRGYQTFTAQTLYKVTADYSFPLLYPDWNISWLVYFKRFRMNVFGDYARWKTGTATRNMASAGADLLADMHVLRFTFPLAVGIRYAQPLVRGNGPAVNLLLDVKF